MVPVGRLGGSPWFEVGKMQPGGGHGQIIEGLLVRLWRLIIWKKMGTVERGVAQSGLHIRNIHQAIAWEGTGRSKSII